MHATQVTQSSVLGNSTRPADERQTEQIVHGTGGSHFGDKIQSIVEMSSNDWRLLNFG